MPDVMVLGPGAVDQLISVLVDRGYRPIGPSIRDGAIVYEELAGADDLPVGWGDEQQPGSYRLVHRGDERCFGYVVGQDSWKRYVFPERSVLWRAEMTEDGFEQLPVDDPPDLALIGVRPCELAALAIQDTVFRGEFPDPDYAARRRRLFLVAVNCTDPAGTCFCTSMGTGPSVGDVSAADLVLTEVVVDGEVRYLAEAGGPTGEDVLAELPAHPAGDEERRAAAARVSDAASAITKRLDAEDVAALLSANLRSPHWDDVAARCLSCASCTLVCPTCFCSTVEDDLSLDGSTATRWRSWDSCFSLDFSYIHGGPMRSGAGHRYRQWLTHKLSWWVDQFGELGCVGCGRCITWCPVGIDLTAEVAAIRSIDVRAGVPVPTPEVVT